MLKKLLKYDLEWINKYISVLFIITLAASLITRILSNFTASFIGNVIYIICKNIVIGCMVSCVVNCLMRVWVRFKNNIYNDESYLTHTLPITKNTIYNAKIISAVISFVFTLAIVAISFIIAYLDDSVMESVKFIFGSGERALQFIVVCLICIAEMIFLFLCGILGIEIGHKANNGKIGKSIITAILIYWASQIMTIIILFICGLFNSGIGSLFTNTNIQSMEIIKNFIYLAFIVYLLYNIILYFLGKKILNQGVNVD